MVSHTGWHVTEVGSESDLDPFGLKRKADWIGRIVGNGKWRDFDIANAEAAAGGEMLGYGQLRRLPGLVAHGAIPGVMRTFR